MTLADCTVMVVEDHEFQRRTTLQILANLGAGELLEAADGEGALALLGADPRPDIVVCDLDMPGMDGVEFLRHVSELRAGTAIVIASGLDDSVLRSAEATARGYGLEVLGAIRKPLTARRLLQAVGLHRPAAAGSAPRAPAAGEDPWAAALREGAVAVRIVPRVELASGRLGAIEARAHRTEGTGASASTIDAAADPSGPLRGETADAVAKLVARVGLAAQRMLSDTGELVDVTLVLPPAALAGSQIVDRLANLASQAGVELARVCVALPDVRGASPAAAPLDLLTRLRVRGFGLGIDGFGTARVDAARARAPPTDRGQDRRRRACPRGRLQTRRRGVRRDRPGPPRPGPRRHLRRLRLARRVGARAAGRLPPRAGRARRPRARARGPRRLARPVERRRMMTSRPPTIRVLFGTLLALVMLLAAGLFSVTILQHETATQRTDAEHQRVTSFRLSDQMRQSSNDLTRMVRLYVETGDRRYRRYYDEILAIRRGVAPRPVNYDSSFWDRVLADGDAEIRTGPPTSLTELMRRAHFSAAEFTALNASLRASDRLARLEERVMGEVAPRIAAGVDRAYVGDVAPHYKLLVDDGYHREKGRIMSAIERFTKLVDDRTSARTTDLQARTEKLLVSQTGILVLLGITLLITLGLAARQIARPLARLTAVTRRIAGGDWSERAPADGVAELRELAGDFNDMADAVERDLAGRRRAEHEARDASERLRTIADRVPGAVFQFHVGVDGGLSVRFASRDGSVHGVYENEEVDFPSVSRAVDADDRGAWIDSMVAAARAGGPWRHEYRIHTRAGEVRWMQAQAVGQPAGDGSGELYGYVADVTERKTLEVQLRGAREAAESADRAKSAFLAMMSHELRTPLVAVTGTLEVLGLGEHLDDEQRALVDVATRSARSLLGVIGDVLDFSKIEAGHLDLVPVQTNVGALVADVVTQHRLAAPGGGAVALRTTIDDRLAARHAADPVRLRQVLGNLVGNAVKFTREGSVDVRVVVAGEADGSQQLVIEVQDTGIGVSAEDQARLFEPFEQAGAQDARRAGGTGLGLVICRQLVEAMGGRVAMTSELGRGTTMRVELALPVAEARDGDALDGGPLERRALPPRADAEREGSLLLLVEDHPVNREILALQLEAIGFQTDTAADAEAALALFERSRYGLVFTDIQLPGADGYELARRVRSLEARGGRARAPVVALTASALSGERERCAAAGMDDVVVKPATLATLAQTLRRWLPDDVWSDAGAQPVAGPAIDQSALDELTGGDQDLGRDIVTRYLESLGDDLEALWQALRDGDADALRRQAHRIAGASRTVGAHAVAAQAARLEDAAQRTADGSELTRLAEQLRETAAR